MEMKKPFVLSVLPDIIYLTAILLCSIMYVFLDTGKAITGELAILQFLFTVFAIIILAVRIQREKIGLPIYIYILFSVAQLVPIYNWVSYYPTAFNLFSSLKMTSWVWVPIHAVLIVCGVGLPIIRKRF